jgi:hypothetical protein
MRRKRIVDDSPKPLTFSVALIAAMFLVYACWIWLDPLKPRAESHDLVITQKEVTYERPQDVTHTLEAEKPAGGIVVEK